MEGKKLIAITVDDGPDGAGTKSFIELAKEFNIPLTFFVVGKYIENNSGQLQEMLDAGCEIGNHSMTHCYLNELDAVGIKSEIDQTNALIETYAPGAQVTLVRAPYFAYNDIVYEAVDYPLIDASLYESNNDKTATLTTLLGASDGDIMLMHTWNTASLQALKEAIPQLQAEGFAFVTVSQLLDAKGVEPIEGTVYRKVKKDLLPEYKEEKNLFTGKSSVSGDWSNWQTAVDLNVIDIMALTEGQALAVEYKSGIAPCLILQSWTGGPNWIQMTATSDNGSTALFTYEDILETYGQALTNVNAAMIRPYGADLTGTEINVMAK